LGGQRFRRELFAELLEASALALITQRSAMVRAAAATSGSVDSGLEAARPFLGPPRR